MSTVHLNVKILGEGGVGKDTLLRWLMDGRYSEIQTASVGPKYDMLKMFEINGKHAILHLWPDGGLSKYKSVPHSYYRNTDAFLLCFDVTNEQSFLQIDYWLGEIFNNACNNELVVYLVGTKSDLKNQRIVSKERILEYSLLKNLKYFETSAKEGNGVHDLYTQFTNDLVQIKNGTSTQTSFPIAKREPSRYNQTCC